MPAPRRTALPAALAVVAALGAARAQEAPVTPDVLAAARDHFERGVALFDHADPGGALAEFQRAYELARRPTVLYNLGAAYQALHRYPEALEALRRYLAATEGADSRQRAAAERAVGELRGLVAHLHVVAPPGAVVALDGRPFDTAAADAVVGVGPHTLTATLAGHEAVRQEILVASGETREVRLELPPTAFASPLPARARLRVTSVTPGTTVVVAGVRHAASAPIELAPGEYAVVVTAPGMRPWLGAIVLAPDAERVLRVSFVPDHQGLGRGYLWATAATAGVFLVGSVTAGSLALSTHADFAQRPAGDPAVAGLAQRGRALSITADALGLGALAVSAVAVYLYTRTEFTPRASSAELAVSPTAGGATVSATVRF